MRDATASADLIAAARRAGCTVAAREPECSADGDGKTWAAAVEQSADIAVLVDDTES